ncbi:hypothetical protein [Muricoccus aerilatus]|uniref:hypothetical protein n=1 Tax=Muricoccus aerilatus TaxID=452982 RepID=UPI0005C12CAB|nr:hypothetical protein [Roseomonas aerilata]
MRKLFAAALAALAVAGATPSFAEGDYVAGPTAFATWTQPNARSPLAGSGNCTLPGPNAGVSPTLANFELSTQSN